MEAADSRSGTYVRQDEFERFENRVDSQFQTIGSKLDTLANSQGRINGSVVVGTVSIFLTMTGMAAALVWALLAGEAGARRTGDEFQSDLFTAAVELRREVIDAERERVEDASSFRHQVGYERMTALNNNIQENRDRLNRMEERVEDEFTEWDNALQREMRLLDEVLQREMGLQVTRLDALMGVVRGRLDKIEATRFDDGDASLMSERIGDIKAEVEQVENDVKRILHDKGP